MGVNHAVTDVFPYSNEWYFQLGSYIFAENYNTGLGNVPGVYVNCSEAAKNLDAYDEDNEAQIWHNAHADAS